MRRPLVIAAIAFSIGVFFALRPGLHQSIGPLLAALCLAAAACLPTLRSRQMLLLAAVFLLAGAGVTWLHSLSRASLPEEPRAYWTQPPTEGTVLEAPVPGANDEYSQLLVRSDAGLVLVRWSDPTEPVFAGQTIRYGGPATSLLNTVNFGIGSAEDYYRNIGVRHAVAAQGNLVQVVATPHFSPRYWVSRLRAWQSGVFDRAVPPDAAPFVKAIWLGEREHLGFAENQRYIDTGTAHMLSISGLHVGMLYAVLEFLLLLRVRDPRRRAGFIMVVLVVYTLAAGWRVATLRALLMVGIFLSARFVRREPDTASSLGLAALLLLAWNPLYLNDAGFLLSFASIASLLLYADLLLAWMVARRTPYFLAGLLAPAIAVQLLTLPLAICYFHVAPLSSPLANLVAVPLTSLVMLGCILVTFCSFVLPPAAILFGHALWFPWVGMDWFLRQLADLKGLALLVPSPTPMAVVLFYVAALLPLLSPAPPNARLLADESAQRARRNRIRLAWASATLGVACIVLWKPALPTGTLDLLDVGNGDAIALYPPEGGAVLVDAGDRSEYRDYGATVVLPYLLAHGVTRLDALVVTHADRDHMGGAFRVLEAMEVDTVFLSAEPSGRPLETGLLAKCAELEVPVRRLGNGDSLTLGGALFEVLHPPKEDYTPESVNDASLVIRVTWPLQDGEMFSTLLTGDIESGTEQALLAEPIYARVLKVPHHGSATSSSAELLESVEPGIAVVSTRTTGRRNALGRGIAERYQEAGIPLWRTDTCGGLRITGDPPNLITARGARGWPLAQ